MGVQDYPSGVHRYQPGETVKPNWVLFISTRKDTPRRLYRYAEAALKRRPHASDRRWIERSMQDGRVYDFVRPVTWANGVNRQLPDHLPPLKVVVISMLHDLPAIRDQMIRSGVKPAGIILSGSGLMVSNEFTSPEVSTLRQVIELARRSWVPVYGICFGFQLLAAMDLGLDAVQWLTTPATATHERVQCSQEGGYERVPVQPGVKRLISGTMPIYVLKRGGIVHWDMPQIMPAIQLHSQYIPAERFAAHQLYAAAYREFELSSGDLHEVAIAQVVHFGFHTWGSQVHPELDPSAIVAATYFRAYLRKLIKEGVDHHRIRQDMRNYQCGSHTAEALGISWMNLVGNQYRRAA